MSTIASTPAKLTAKAESLQEKSSFFSYSVESYMYGDDGVLCFKSCIFTHAVNVLAFYINQEKVIMQRYNVNFDVYIYHGLGVEFNYFL